MINLPMVVPQPPKEGDECLIPWCTNKCNRCVGCKEKLRGCSCGKPPCEECPFWIDNWNGKWYEEYRKYLPSIR